MVQYKAEYQRRSFAGKEDKMTDERILRINELARKAKTVGLTPEEEAERAALRKEYVAAFRNSLEVQLKSIVVVDPEGNRSKLQKKEDPTKKPN